MSSHALITAGALRQLRHNDGSDGLIFAYDKEITDRFLAAANSEGKFVEAIALLNAVSLLWHGDEVGKCSEGKFATGFKFDSLMVLIEAFTFPYHKGCDR